MAHSQVADGGVGPLLQIVGANMFNKLSWTTNKEWCFRFGVVLGANNSSPYEISVLQRASNLNINVRMDSMEGVVAKVWLDDCNIDSE
jgi:hypothetical protein